MYIYVYILIIFSLTKMKQFNIVWFNDIMTNVHDEQWKWNAALFAAQRHMISIDDSFLNSDYTVKVNCYVRFVHLTSPQNNCNGNNSNIQYPTVDQIGIFREISGTVSRRSERKLLELKREFICSKCGENIVIAAEYGLMYRFDVPKFCSYAGCTGTIHKKSDTPNANYCVNYQEIKIQEVTSQRNIPQTLIITLENDLVDSCQPGDHVIVW